MKRSSCALHPGTPRGVQGHCLLCKTLKEKARYRDDPEKFRLKKRLARSMDPVRNRELNRRWRKANPDKVKHNNLKLRGFTIAIYKQMLQDQENKCAICSTDLSRLQKRFVHADHCHSTMVPRGILCQWCNTGLGAFRDDHARMKAAIVYLEKHHTRK